MEEKNMPTEAGIAAFTIPEFCARNRMGESTYHEMKKKGRGPREMAVGRRGKRITREAERDWHKAQEAAAAAEKPAA